MSALLQDLRCAGRTLRKSPPAYALMIVATLALGIGAATTVFTLIDGVLLKPLPYPESERLVLIRQKNPHNEWNTSVVDYQAIASLNRSFEAVAAMRSLDAIVTGSERPQWVSARWVTADFFRLMGVAPARGRGFRAGEDRPGADRVVVLGHAFAERRFGTDTDPLGQTLTLDGSVYTVVGIMPPGVEQLPGMRADLWPAMQLAEPSRRGPFFWSTVARLKPGVTLAQAADDLEAIGRRIFPQWQAGFWDETARLTPRSLHDAVVGQAGNALWIAFGAVLVVLLIAVVNVANLVLMRVAERARDLAVRAALGASRRRLARLLITESLLLAGLGGLAGLGLAALLLELYRSLGPELPRLAELAIDARAIAFAGVAVLAGGIAFGSLPLLFGHLSQGSPALRQGRATMGRGQQRFRNALVTLEFALALPLLIAAGLLVNSLIRLQRVDPGFDADHLLTARVALLETGYPDAASQLEFWERALPELRAMPGVLAAGLAGAVPPSCGCTNNFDVVGRPAEQGSQPQSPWILVTPGYFEALHVPLLEGRWFDGRDTPDSTRVVLVSETWARRYFPGEAAVGKQLYEGGDRSEPVTVAGVVGDVKFDGLENPGDSVYAPLSQGSANPAYLILRTGPDPLALVEPTRSTLARLDPTLVPTEVSTMEGRLRESLTDQRGWVAVIAGFAVAALLLSAVGVFAVLSYYVSRQQREIGIRSALGADGGRIVRLVIRRGFGLALAGTLIGIALSLLLTRSLESLLFQVERTDPLTLLCATALLLGIALAASWLPARRAARVDPGRVLQAE